VFVWQRQPLEMLGEILEGLDWELPVLQDCNASTERADNMIRGYSVICERYRAAAAAHDDAAAAAAAAEGERYMRNPNLSWAVVFWFKHPYYIYCAQATATGQPLQQLPEEVWNRILPAMALSEDQQQQVCDLFLAFEELQAPYVRRRQQLMQLLSRSGESLQSLLGLRAQSGGTVQRNHLQQQQQQGVAAAGRRPATAVSDTDAAAAAAAAVPGGPGAVAGVEPASSAAARLLRSSSSAAVASSGPSPPAASEGEAANAGLTLNMAEDLAQLLTAEFHRLAWLEFCFHYLAACLLTMPQYLELAAGYDGHLQFTTWEAKVAQQVLQRRRQQQQQQVPRQTSSSEGYLQAHLESLPVLLKQRSGQPATSSSSIATCTVAAGVGEPVATPCWPPAPKTAQTGGVAAAAAAAAAAVLAQGPPQRPPSAASDMDVDALAAQQGLALHSSGGSSSSTLPVLEGSPCAAQEHPPPSHLLSEQLDQQQPRDQQLHCSAWPVVSLAAVPATCSPQLCEELPSLGMASPGAPAVAEAMDEGLLLPAAAWVSPAAASAACPVVQLGLQQQRLQQQLQGDGLDPWWLACSGQAKGAPGSSPVAAKGSSAAALALLQPLADTAGCMNGTLADALLEPITAGGEDEAEHVDWAAEYLLQPPQSS
jgi:hypothetical protein